VATAAPIKTVLDAMVTRVLQNNEHARGTSTGGHGGGGGDDPRQALFATSARCRR
jgi:5-methylcytosine-specific restriction protein A